jgi:hypothetical protein
MDVAYVVVGRGIKRTRKSDAASSNNRYDFVKGAQKNAVMNTYA